MIVKYFIGPLQLDGLIGIKSQFGTGVYYENYS